MERASELSGTIAEIASHSSDLRTYRVAVLTELKRRLGFEFGSLQSVDAGATGYPDATSSRLWERNLALYVGEFAEAEVARMCAGVTVRGTEVFSTRRRESLSMFTEWMSPLGLHASISRIWRDADDVFAYTFGRSGRGASFADSELALLDQVLPVHAVAEHFLAGRGEAAPSMPWCDNHRITGQERRIVELITKGLTNREVAALLRVSHLTVRNHLARIFRKAEVTTRAELVFRVMSDLNSVRREQPGSVIAFKRHVLHCLSSSRQPTVRGVRQT